MSIYILVKWSLFQIKDRGETKNIANKHLFRLTAASCKPLAQPFECRKTSLPDGALHNVQKELENMINAIDKDIYSFTPSYGKYLIDCWLGDELVDKLLDVSCQYEKLIKLK